ncbi:peptidoglycan-binding protein, partial [Candidatus Parcubacteria bacterium]|nr:peptidoglycan-binding protein [Candidatus Parcubacteria bacterium]
SSDTDLSHYTLYVDGVVNTDSISGTSQTVSSALSCGNHTWYVKATDGAGNSTNASQFSFVISCGGGTPGGVSIAGMIPTPRMQRIVNGVVTYLDEIDGGFVDSSVSASDSATVQNPSSSSSLKTKNSQLKTNLWSGLRNPEVVSLQQSLRELGLFDYPENTGYYGQATRQAVEKFQCQYDIICSGTPDTTGYGVFGPKTRLKFNEIFSSSSVSANSSSSSISNPSVSASNSAAVQRDPSSSSSYPLPTTNYPLTVTDIEKQILALQQIVSDLTKQLQETLNQN